MQEREEKYCELREVSTLVVTWNAGATKPTYLGQDHRDSDSFRDIFQSRDPPEIIVFGFQELIDLEKKSNTACKLIICHERIAI